MDSSTTVLALREVYETQYGIFNHDAPNVAKEAPLALVAMHRKEDAYSYSMERHYLWRFRLHKIPEKWGLSLNQWLELPIFIAEDLLNIETAIAVEEMKELHKRELEQRRMEREARVAPT